LEERVTSLNTDATFLEHASRWLDQNVPERWRRERAALSEIETIAVRREWDRLLYAGGYSGLSLPPEVGGQGLGIRQEVLFHELAARAHAPEGIGRIGKILTVPTLIAHGSPWQRDRYIAPIVRGEEVWCQGFSEPGAGSDLASISSLATKIDGGYLISGHKIWTSFARHADRSIFLARTSTTAPRHQNLSYFLLDMHQPGITFRSIKQISGDSDFAELFVDQAFVADEDRVGGEGDGWNIAMTTLMAERGGIEAITRYVEIRGDLDLLMRCCTPSPEMTALVDRFDVRLELVRWQVMKSLDWFNDGPVYFAQTSTLKIMWSELWQEITEAALVKPCPLHLEHWRNRYLETRAASIYSGSNEIQRNIIGDRVLGLPR
jgi:alkylation response protein AidB-like acyl-CoA dehydrogenase